MVGTTPVVVGAAAAGFVIVAVGSGTVYVVKTLGKNGIKWISGKYVDYRVDKQCLLPVNKRVEKFNCLTQQEVCALLVNGVYSRDRVGMDGDGVVKQLVETFYEVDFRTEMYTRLDWDRMYECCEQEEVELGLKHYLRKDPHPNCVAPRLVIALRGTKMSSCQDIKDDTMIVFKRLDKSERFEALWQVVNNIIRTFREKYYGTYGEICITGHSLGAAFAILLGQRFVIEMNVLIAVHAFNPPFIPRLKLFGTLALEILLSGYDTQVQIAQAVQKFLMLVNWVPVLYINEYDWICKKILPYYGGKLGKSVALRLQNGMVDDADLAYDLLNSNGKSQLVPSVHIRVSKTRTHPHFLQQWLKYTATEQEWHDFRLMASQYIGPPRIEQSIFTLVNTFRGRADDFVRDVKSLFAPVYYHY